MSFQSPRMWKNACSSWDDDALMSVVPKSLDASDQPLLPLVSRGRMGKLQVAVPPPFLGIPRVWQIKDWNLVGLVLHQASEQMCYSWLRNGKS